MKIETLEEKIKLRANEIVQGRIKAFKIAFKNSLEALFVEGCGHGRNQFGQYGFVDEKFKENRDYDPIRDRADVIRLSLEDKTPDASAVRGEKQKPWPARLWRDEEQRVRNEVMDKMDELQRMLLAKPASAGDAEPGEQRA